MELLGPLGFAYIATRGYAAPEVGPILIAPVRSSRAQWRTPTFAMMRGHFAHHIVRGDFPLCIDPRRRRCSLPGRSTTLASSWKRSSGDHDFIAATSRALRCFAAALSDYDDRAHGL